MTIENQAYDRASNILVVDDDDTLLKFFKIHLNKYFSKVLVVSNATDAMETVINKEVDLVISDIKMPRVDGTQLAKKVKAHDPSIPVFLVSGALIDEKLEGQIGKRADGFLTKPFTIDELHDFIDRGVALRQCYVRLFDIVKDPKKFLEVLNGKRQLRFLSDQALKQEAAEILRTIKSHQEEAAA